MQGSSLSAVLAGQRAPSRRERPWTRRTPSTGSSMPAGEIEWSRADAKLRRGDTIYLTVADKDRNMVSLIQSNYRGMGSGMCPPGLGFGLQDRGEL